MPSTCDGEEGGVLDRGGAAAHLAPEALPPAGCSRSLNFSAERLGKSAPAAPPAIEFKQNPGDSHGETTTDFTTKRHTVILFEGTVLLDGLSAALLPVVRVRLRGVTCIKVPSWEGCSLRAGSQVPGPCGLLLVE